MAAEEGQVIGVHSVSAWEEHLKKGQESKKLVIFNSLTSSLVSFSSFLCLNLHSIMHVRVFHISF